VFLNSHLSRSLETQNSELNTLGTHSISPTKKAASLTTRGIRPSKAHQIPATRNTPTVVAVVVSSRCDLTCSQLTNADISNYVGHRPGHTPRVAADRPLRRYAPCARAALHYSSPLRQHRPLLRAVPAQIVPACAMQDLPGRAGH